MSLESKIDDLIAALDANTKALTGGKDETRGRRESSDEPRSSRSSSDGKDAPKDEPRTRRSRSDVAKNPPEMTEADFKKAIGAFLDCPDTKEGDAEYDLRLEKVIDPVFEKAGVKEIADLPEKYWPSVIEAIAEYGKGAENGGARRSRGR